MISVNCPAKINLGLRVLGRRPDGYHDLQGMMVALPWFDRLEAAPAAGCADDFPECLPGIRMGVTRSPDCRNDPVPKDATNIVVRAAALCLSYPGVAGLVGQGGISIHLTKDIPSGTGLGGASSDAAGAISAIDILARSRGMPGLTLDQMRAVAARVGSDSVFFLNPAPSMIVGRGEDFAPVDFEMDFSVVVVVPVQRLSTAHVFARLDELRKCNHSGADWLTSGGDGDISPCLSVYSPSCGGRDYAPGIFDNDLSEAVFDICPRSAELLDLFKDSSAFAASVTGSGSAVFGLFGDIGSAFGFGRTMSGRLLPGEIVRVFQMGREF